MIEKLLVLMVGWGFLQATFAGATEQSSGSFYFEGSPRPPYIKFDPSQRPESVTSTATWSYLNNRPVKVLRNDVSTYSRGVKLKGLDLGQVDRSIDPTDEAAVGAEVRRYLGTVESLIGETSELALENFHVSAMHGGGTDARVFAVRFEQIAHGARLGRGTMIVDGNTVVLLDVFFGDPMQPNLHKDSWASAAILQAYAEEALRRELRLEDIDQAWLTEPRLFLGIVDDDGSVMPTYHFYYRGYAARVNALTLETSVWSTVKH